MNLPRISIVTPSYNQARFLGETMESILSQDYPNVEYIVVDGGSTDGSVEIIKRYERHLAYWVSEKDGGQSDAIMKGFDRVTGEIFTWVNSDDVLFPGCLRQIAQAYVEHREPDLIHTNACYIDAESRITRFVRVPCQSRFMFFRGVWNVVAPTLFYKTSFFRSVGGLNKAYYLSMDFDVWMRMMLAGARTAHVGRYLGGFRWHPRSKTVVSLGERRTCEDSETTEIFRRNLPRSSPMGRQCWRYLHKVYQVVNLNYATGYRDLRRLKGSRKWQEVFRASVDSSCETGKACCRPASRQTEHALAQAHPASGRPEQRVGF